MIALYGANYSSAVGLRLNFVLVSSLGRATIGQLQYDGRRCPKSTRNTVCPIPARRGTPSDFLSGRRASIAGPQSAQGPAPRCPDPPIEGASARLPFASLPPATRLQSESRRRFGRRPDPLEVLAPRRDLCHHSVAQLCARGRPDGGSLAGDQTQRGEKQSGEHLGISALLRNQPSAAHRRT